MTRSSQYVLKKWTKNSKRRVSQSLVCETSTTSKDHKANIGRRFKELYRWHTQLAAKATKSKKAYDIAISDFAKILEEMDA